MIGEVTYAIDYLLQKACRHDGQCKMPYSAADTSLASRFCAALGSPQYFAPILRLKRYCK